MRTVVEAQERAQCLRLTTRRMGWPSRRRWSWYQPAIAEHRPRERRRGGVISGCWTGADAELYWRQGGWDAVGDGLEHSFGPAMCADGSEGDRCGRGDRVGEAESAATATALTLGILWLDHCRQPRRRAQAFWRLKVVVPAGAVADNGGANGVLNHAAADFEL